MGFEKIKKMDKNRDEVKARLDIETKEKSRLLQMLLKYQKTEVARSKNPSLAVCSGTLWI